MESALYKKNIFYFIYASSVYFVPQQHYNVFYQFLSVHLCGCITQSLFHSIHFQLPLVMIHTELHLCIPYKLQLPLVMIHTKLHLCIPINYNYH